ncbi:MAG: GAF domain-containing protein [Chloroflexi bacterium]|nr:GAF domain-containing protein [Chloroflexota bacterium]
MIKRITDPFIAPSPQVQSPIRRQRAMILAAVTLVLFLIALPSTLIPFLLDPALGVWGLSAPITFAIGYVLSRTPYPEVGGSIVIYIQVAVLLVSAAVGILPTDIWVLVIIPVLLATLVLPLVPTLIAAFGAATGMTAIYIASGTPAALIGPTGVPATLSVIAAVTAYLRERDLGLIADQTTELETYSSQLEEEVELRTRNILATAEIGRRIAESREMERLLGQTVDLIVDNFDFYHAQIFLVDEAREWAILRASTGEAGRQLLERKHRLAVGSESVIGQVVTRAEPVIALDTDTDAVHRRNELLPNTRSEMALPLRTTDTVLGVLDIQSVKANAFGQADISIFQTLADQLAVSVERIRLFQRTQEDLAQIENLNRQLTRESWNEYALRRSDARGYQTGQDGVEPVTEVDGAGKLPGTLSLPLTVRGETIGVLDVAPRGGKEPDPETQLLLEAVAERVAQALENTRLTEQSRRQAEQEAVLSRLTTELQTMTDINLILRTVAEQTSRVMGTSRGFVHLVLEYDEDQLA